MLAAMERARRSSAWIELRLDYLAGPREIDRIIHALSKKTFRRNHLIVTLRRREIGGGFPGSVEAQIRRLLQAAGLQQWVDLEIESIDDRGIGIVEELRERGARIIVSYHNFQKTPANLPAIVRRLKAARPDILKIATHCNSMDDAARLLRLQDRLHEEGIHSLILGMGTSGTATRILGPSRGVAFTYAAQQADKASAPGQLTVDELARQYRIHRINRSTRVYGVVGYPLGHSLSPVIYNSAFAASEMNAVHLRLETGKLGDFRRWTGALRIRGLSVTLPYKTAIMKYLDHLDSSAKFADAVNTVRFNGRQAIGYNTDVIGIEKPLQQAGLRLNGAKVLLLGAGGAAQAAAAFLVSQSAEVYVFNRTVSKARRLARQFRLRVIQFRELKDRRFALIVNATSVGMWPNIKASPIDLSGIRTDAVFDLVYKPPETKLLGDARRRGMKTISGIEMFLAQAFAQFRILTGRSLPASAVRETLKRVQPDKRS